MPHPLCGGDSEANIFTREYVLEICKTTPTKATQELRISKAYSSRRCDKGPTPSTPRRVS